MASFQTVRRMILDNRNAFLPVLGNATYVVIASGFLMTDMLQLRLLLVTGYSGLVAYHALQVKPMKIPLCWSALFVAVNATAAAMLLADRYAPNLNSSENPDGEELYQQHFSDVLTRGQFMQLLSLARRRKLPAGTVLTKENVPCGDMYFLVRGQANVYHGRKTDEEAKKNGNDDNSKTIQKSGNIASNARRQWTKRRTVSRPLPPNVATIEEGGFVNDVAFARGAGNTSRDKRVVMGAYGTVILAHEENDVLVWDVATLRKHLASRPVFDRNIKYCMSDHLVRSLLRQREAAHQRQRAWQHDEDNESPATPKLAASSSV